MKRKQQTARLPVWNEVETAWRRWNKITALLTDWNLK